MRSKGEDPSAAYWRAVSLVPRRPTRSPDRVIGPPVESALRASRTFRTVALSRLHRSSMTSASSSCSAGGGPRSVTPYPCSTAREVVASLAGATKHRLALPVFLGADLPGGKALIEHRLRGVTRARIARESHADIHEMMVLSALVLFALIAAACLCTSVLSLSWFLRSTVVDAPRGCSRVRGPQASPSRFARSHAQPAWSAASACARERSCVLHHGEPL